MESVSRLSIIPSLFDSRGSVMVADRNGNRKALTNTLLGHTWPGVASLRQRDLVYRLPRSFIQQSYGCDSVREAAFGVGRGWRSHRAGYRAGWPGVVHPPEPAAWHRGLFPGQKGETDLSWQDWSLPLAISPDGKWIFFAEEGDGGGPKYSAYMRATDGSPAIRLGDGVPNGVSPDGKWVAAVLPGEPQQLTLLADPRRRRKELSQPGFNYDFVEWLPDGKRLLVIGNEPGKRTRNYLQDATGGSADSRDARRGCGQFVAGWKIYFYRSRRNYLDALSHRRRPAKKYQGALPTPRRFVTWPRAAIVIFSPRSARKSRTRSTAFDPATGDKQVWKELAPVDRAGVYNVGLSFK